MTELNGKKAVVTGGAMGIGLATTRRLLHKGCDVTIWDWNEEAMENAVKTLSGIGPKVFAHKCDVSDKEMVLQTDDSSTQRLQARTLDAGNPFR